MNDATLGPFITLAASEPYQQKGSFARDLNTTSSISKIPFRPSSPPKLQAFPGDVTGCFSGYPHSSDSDPEYANRPPRPRSAQPKQIQKNIYTNPGKKGGAGYYGLTIGPNPGYLLEPQNDKAKTARLFRPLDIPVRPFKAMSNEKGNLFDNRIYEPYENNNNNNNNNNNSSSKGQQYANSMNKTQTSRGTQNSQAKTGQQPFRPASPGKSGKFGTIGPYPQYDCGAHFPRPPKPRLSHPITESGIFYPSGRSTYQNPTPSIQQKGENLRRRGDPILDGEYIPPSSSISESKSIVLLLTLLILFVLNILLTAEELCLDQCPDAQYPIVIIQVLSAHLLSFFSQNEEAYGTGAQFGIEAVGNQFVFVYELLNDDNYEEDEDDGANTDGFIYELLLFNPELSGTDICEVIGCVCCILQGVSPGSGSIDYYYDDDEDDDYYYYQFPIYIPRCTFYIRLATLICFVVYQLALLASVNRLLNYCNASFFSKIESFSFFWISISSYFARFVVKSSIS
ncbi:MAG: hypothetical protein EZS28_017147 [Streblomastix strix]|uniref:Cilia-and flagella-associated protein 96 n=1 Tax=Streblomastix strix TaxID=222440 RepID=A0A5J4VYN7_9EUKA|nr:MAG: hypothetical protein EZS28_017147 [Streblomastix strix]